MSEFVAILITGYSATIFGIVSFIISLWIIYKYKILHNAFGLISAAQSIVEGSILLDNAFIVYTIIAINPEAAESFTIIFAGLISIFCNGAVAYLQLLKAINRSIAIIFPTKYQSVFSTKKTTYYLFFIFIFSLMYDMAYIIDSCYLIINPEQFTWNYSAKGCTEKFAYNYFTWCRGGVLGVTLFFDGITFCYLRMFRKRLLQHSNKKMMNAEIRFFFQTFLTSIFYGIMLLSPRFLRPYATTPFLFFLTTYATILLFHSTNELKKFVFVLFCLFNLSNLYVATYPQFVAKPNSEMLTDVFERIRVFLRREGYIFQENIDVDINLANLVIDTEIRPIDQLHVDFLIRQMKEEPCSINNILNQTPIIGFHLDRFRTPNEILGIIDEEVRIIDGNHRLVASRLFNAAQTGNPIFLFPISFYIASKVPLEHKLILMSLAEEKAYENKKPFDKWEIMKYTRLLLLKCPSALGLKFGGNMNSYEQKEYGKKVVEAVTKFFHICHPSLVLRNVWKTTRISDKDFEKMLKAFPKLPSGFNVHDFDILFNKYPLSPTRITVLITTMSSETSWCHNHNHHQMRITHSCASCLCHLRNNLRNVKPEYLPSLKHYGAYNPNWSDDDHLEFIVGEDYFATNGDTKTLKVLEKYLAAKRRYLAPHEGCENKIGYLQRNFQTWYEQVQSKKKSSKNINKPNELNINRGTEEINNQQSEETVPKTVVDNFINKLIQSNREAFAAFVVHYFVRPQNQEQPLPEFYLKYLKNDKMDFTKLPKDDGLIGSEETVNLYNFGHHTLLKEAEENNKIAAAKRKRKTATQNDASKKAKRIEMSGHLL